MNFSSVVSVLLLIPALGNGNSVQAQKPGQPYRLNSVDLKQPIIWDAECRQPTGSGLAFGGQDQNANDGRPHTRLLVDGEWKSIGDELRAANPLQKFYQPAWTHRQTAKKILAKARGIYFQGKTTTEELKLLESEINPALGTLAEELKSFAASLSEETNDSETTEQLGFAKGHLQQASQLLPSFKTGVTVAGLKQLHGAQIHLELAAEAFDAEPPPRAMNCGTPRISRNESGPAGNTLVYDSKTKLYLLFGGDHLDYLTNDTWVFDPAQRRWFQRHPKGAPAPRANHRLTATGDGTVRMTGGFTYSSNTEYVGGQYLDSNEGTWTYDIAANEWTGGKLVAADSRVYRTGPFHPDFYLTGPKPDAPAFETWLKEIPANEWMPTNPPHLPRLNRDWGTARIDHHRDMMLRWSGGHSAHGGTDVLHFHFATNRWELPFPVEFPLGQLYSNTSYPNGFNFNMRPWMTGHTYQNYDYDPPSKMMIKAGRPRHTYVYNPDLGDWIGRHEKPRAMQYNSCFYTLTLTATPGGVVCWDRNGKVHRYEHQTGKWKELELTGDKLPGAYVDNSSIAYDSKRDRVLMVNTPGYGKTFDGTIWSVDLKSLTVTQLKPENRSLGSQFANIDKCCYDSANDLFLLGTYLKDAGEHTPTPAYDCETNQWVKLNLKYPTGKRYGNTTRAFPHVRSDGLMFDARRNLIWGTNTNGQVFVLRLDRKTAGMNP